MALEANGMKGYDISDDEMSKSHARYMIGGRHDVEHERVFRFGGYYSRTCFTFEHGSEIFLNLKSRIPRASWRAAYVPSGSSFRMEHQSLSLSESRRRYVVICSNIMTLVRLLLR